MPNDDSSMWSKQWWSIVSNAALRSRRTSIAPPWVSTACRRSFWTHNRAVSVLYSWRYADWYTSYRSFIFRWSTSCTHTMRSISLDRKERLETGRKFFKISESSMAFFRSGKMKALFSSEFYVRLLRHIREKRDGRYAPRYPIYPPMHAMGTILMKLNAVCTMLYCPYTFKHTLVNTLRPPGQNDRHFADIFKHIFFYGNFYHCLEQWWIIVYQPTRNPF